MAALYETKRYLNLRDVGIISTDGTRISTLVGHATNNASFTLPGVGGELAIAADLAGFIANPMESNLQTAGFNITVADGADAYFGNSSNKAKFEVVSSATNASEVLNIINTDGTSASAIALTASAGGIALTSSTSLTLTDGAATLTLNGTGATSVSGATTLALDCNGALELNSSGGAISIGQDAVAGDINIGTGDSARTITVGHASSTSVGINASAINLTSVGALALTDGAATLTLNGTGATSVSGGTTISLDCSGALTLAPTTATSISMLSNTVLSPLNVETTTNAKTSALSAVIPSARALEVTTKVIIHNTSLDQVVSYKIESIFKSGFFVSLPNTAISVGADTFTSNTVLPSNLTTGQLVRLVLQSGTIPGGLTDATDYYIIEDTTTTFKLASTIANAIAGTQINITTSLTSTCAIYIPSTLGGPFTFDAAAAVNDTTNLITLTTDEYNALETGMKVIYSIWTGTVVGGFADNTAYYVVKDTTPNIKLATTLANAIAGTTIDIASDGTGLNAIYVETVRVGTDTITTKGTNPSNYTLSVIGSGSGSSIGNNSLALLTVGPAAQRVNYDGHFEVVSTTQ